MHGSTRLRGHDRHTNSISSAATVPCRCALSRCGNYRASDPTSQPASNPHRASCTSSAHSARDFVPGRFSDVGPSQPHPHACRRPRNLHRRTPSQRLPSLIILGEQRKSILATRVALGNTGYDIPVDPSDGYELRATGRNSFCRVTALAYKAALARTGFCPTACVVREPRDRRGDQTCGSGRDLPVP
jgi:hypothetical protein